MSAAQAALEEKAAQGVVAVTPTMPAPFEGPTRIRSVCAESLWVRDAPMGVRRGGLEMGERVEVFEPVEGWSQIAAGRWRGLWVRERWLCKGGS